VFFGLIIALLVGDERIFDIVTLYIAHLCIHDLTYSSIRVYIYSIHTYFMDLSVGILDITKSYLVSQVLHAVKLKIGDRLKSKLAIFLELLIEIYCNMTKTMIDIRD
jgi:hypothetical protein